MLWSPLWLWLHLSQDLLQSSSQTIILPHGEKLQFLSIFLLSLQNQYHVTDTSLNFFNENYLKTTYWLYYFPTPIYFQILLISPLTIIYVLYLSKNKTKQNINTGKEQKMKIRSNWKKDKQNKKPHRHRNNGSCFVHGKYFWAWGFPWSMVDISATFHLEKKYFLFPSRHQLLISSYLEVGTYMHLFLPEMEPCLIWSCKGLVWDGTV